MFFFYYNTNSLYQKCALFSNSNINDATCLKFKTYSYLKRCLQYKRFYKLGVMNIHVCKYVHKTWSLNHSILLYI